MKSCAFLLPTLPRKAASSFEEDAAFFGMDVQIMSNYLQRLIQDYEQNIQGNTYIFVLDNGETIAFEIKRRNVPHLMGIGRLQLRQIKGKYASQLYSMLKKGAITIETVISAPDHKEVYKKIMNFHHLVSMLKCGDMVKLVKCRGSLKSSYLLYLDHQPEEIIHLGLAQDDAKNWYPESLLILQRNVTAYIDNQMPVKILDRRVIMKDQCADTEADRNKDQVSQTDTDPNSVYNI